MTNSAAAVEVIFLGVTLLAILGVHEFVLKPAFVALFKHSVLTARRKLFVLVAEGKLPAQHLFNVRLRGTMNSAVRHAEEITAFGLLITIVLTRNLPRPAPIPSYLEGLNEGLQAECVDIYLDFGVACALYTMARAAWLWPFIIVGFSLACIGAMAHGTHKQIRRFIAEKWEPIMQRLMAADASSPVAQTALIS